MLQAIIFNEGDTIDSQIKLTLLTKSHESSRTGIKLIVHFRTALKTLGVPLRARGYMFGDN